MYLIDRHVLYDQSCDDIDGWINEIESQIVTEDVGHDLTTVNLLVNKQNVSFIYFSHKNDLQDLSIMMFVMFLYFFTLDIFGFG